MSQLPRAVYGRLPAPVQDVAVSAVGLAVSRRRYGGLYDEIEKQVRSRGRWSSEQVVEFRNERLREFAAECRNRVPFYSGRDYSGLDQIETLEDLASFPLIDKALVRGELESLATRDRRGVRWSHTSGTTGAGLRFPATSKALQEQWAVWWRYRYNHGITPSTWCAHFGGRDIASGTRIWRIDRAQRRIVFSAYHTNDSHLDDVIRVLNERRPPWIHGYPSVISLIAQRLLETQGALEYQVGWVSIGAENLEERQRDLMRSAFGTQAIQHYGLAEMAANISECRLGSMHIDEDFAAVEVLDGEIIGSSMANSAFPLLRYRTGDLASLDGDGCSCGQPGRVVGSIDGRSEDYVILRDGTRLGRLDHVLKDATTVKRAQFLQRAAGTTVLLIEPGLNFDPSDLHEIGAYLARLAGDRLSVEFRIVEQIPATGSGKHRLVIHS